MRTCPACHRENPDDSDFCEACGEYLRWDPTAVNPAVPRAPGGAGAGPPGVPPPIRPVPGGGRSPADAVSITLRSLADDADPREGVRVACAPGATASLVASVRNQSGIVDNYDLRVEGLPDGWWTITPATAYLVPYGAPSGRYEQDAQVQLHPPRTAQAEAREWPIRVVAGSRASGTDAGSASARLTVQPYQSVETELRPERATGRRRGKFTFAVRNLANAPIELEFSATDPEEKCKFAFKQRRGTAQPGRRTGSEMIVKPPKQIWVGRPVDHAFQISAKPPGSDETVISRDAVFRQRPWFAWWVPIALVAALALGVAAVKLLQHPPTISTPNLENQNASAVQKFLEHIGLLLSSAPAKTKVVAAKEVGKIVGQNPDAGVPLSPGKAVSVIVGIAAKQATVPQVCNGTLASAQKALKKAGLTAGPVQPSAQDPTAKTLATGCEVPAANQTVAKGSPVSLFLQSAGANALPSVSGLSAAAATSKLQAAGLKTISIPVLDTAITVGNVVTQTPGATAALAKGSTVYLYVSALPQVAYDSGGSIFVSSFGATGPAGSPLQLTPGTETFEPSWNAAGTEIAFIDDTTGMGTVEVAAADGKTPPVTVATGADYHRPVFAPLVGSDLLAFTRWDTGDATSSLCILNPDQSGAQPSCTAPSPLLLDRPTWSPDGMSIAVVAETPGTTPTPAGVLWFHSSTPFSPNASDWTPDATQYLTASDPTADPTFLAWSPVVSGTSQLAYASNLSVFLTSSPATAGKSIFDYTVAPAFSWRADGDLAVGGQDCSTGVPAITMITPTGTPTPLGISGCNPSVEPLALPPTG